MPSETRQESSRPAGAERPFVVAVVLTWNDVDMVRRCLQSLEASRYQHLSLIVVDNGSSFPTLPPLREEFPDVEMIQLDRNYGFAGGCNRGMERALEKGADYVFLLNNDTIVDERAIDELVDAVEARDDVAMASALLLDPGEPKTVQSYRGWVFRDRAHLTRPGEHAAYTEAYRATVESEFLSACAVLFRAEALREVGLFDERLFTNWEDYDLCLRFSDAGWKLLMVGAAEVVHRRHQTTGATSPFIVYYSTRNRLICLFRYGTPLGILRNLPFIVRSFYWKVRGYGFTNIACHAAFARAFLDFFLGVRGAGGAPASRNDATTGSKR